MKNENQNIQLLVISSSSGHHLETAQRAIKNGISVISTSNKISDVVGLLKLEDLAKENDAMIVAGSAFAPGLTYCVGRFCVKRLDSVDEIISLKMVQVDRMCAHHRAMKRPSIEWCDGQWVRRPGGSGGNSFGFLNLSLEQIVIGQHYPIPYSCSNYSHQLQELLLSICITTR